MVSNGNSLGEGLALLSASLASAIVNEFRKEDIFVIASFLSSIASNIYLITNTRLDLAVARAPIVQEEAQAEPGI